MWRICLKTEALDGNEVSKKISRKDGNTNGMKRHLETAYVKVFQHCFDDKIKEYVVKEKKRCGD